MQELQLNRCERCGKEAKIFLGYGPHRFCKEHFNDFFEKRVKRTIRQSKMISYGEKIAVGVSGGKDSMVTLHLLNKLLGNQNKIEVIMIDEGIKGYRDKSMQVGIKYCKENGIPYNTVAYEKELGVDMEGVFKKIQQDEKLGSTCGFCGVFRRQFLNSKALEIKADKLATGHNLDDEVQSIAMSLFGNQLARIAGLGEIAGVKKHDKFVPRIKPLYETPEKEIISYAAFNGIEHYSAECCPYSWMAKRNHYRKMINELEESVPGTKYSILSTFRELKPMLVQKELEKEPQFSQCEKCGSPCRGIVCNVCIQLEKLEKMQSQKKVSKSLKKKSKITCVDTKNM